MVIDYMILLLCGMIIIEVITMIVQIKSMISLRKEVENLNKDMDRVFTELFNKIKAVTDLVLKVQIDKMGKIEEVKVKGEKFEGDLKIK
ncbi:MAG: hypothetical protein K6T54_07045 [Ignavibacterium sp.]|nr:hypothetical protein [Ignavibacterium sp.]